MNIYFVAAAIAAVVTFALHTWLAGPSVAGPLLRSRDMHDVAKYTNYYCWHLVTITLLVMAGCFAWAAFDPEGVELAWVAFILSVTFMLWSLFLVGWKRQSFRYMPQWALFLVISVFAGFGLMAV